MIEIFLFDRIDKIFNIEICRVVLANSFKASSICEDLVNKRISSIAASFNVKHDADNWKLSFICVGIDDVQLEIVVLAIESMFRRRVEMHLKWDESLLIKRLIIEI